MVTKDKLQFLPWAIFFVKTFIIHFFIEVEGLFELEEFFLIVFFIRF